MASAGRMLGVTRGSWVQRSLGVQQLESMPWLPGVNGLCAEPRGAACRPDSDERGPKQQRSKGQGQGQGCRTLYVQGLSSSTCLWPERPDPGFRGADGTALPCLGNPLPGFTLVPRKDLIITLKKSETLT